MEPRTQAGILVCISSRITTNRRLPNAVSWIARKTEDPERKLELMKVAGEMLPKAA
jgi:hypothetical protein